MLQISLEIPTIWTDAIVQWPEDSVVQVMILVYSYFNGVYMKADGQVSQRWPIYVEQNKYDQKPFTETGFDIGHDQIVPAEIKYCGGHWIFTHKFNQKLRQLEFFFLFPTPIYVSCLKSSYYFLLTKQDR